MTANMVGFLSLEQPGAEKDRNVVAHVVAAATRLAAAQLDGKTDEDRDSLARRALIELAAREAPESVISAFNFYHPMEPLTPFELEVKVDQRKQEIALQRRRETDIKKEIIATLGENGIDRTNLTGDESHLLERLTQGVLDLRFGGVSTEDARFAADTAKTAVDIHGLSPALKAVIDAMIPPDDITLQ